MDEQTKVKTMIDIDDKQKEEILKGLSIPHQIATRIALDCTKENLSCDESLEIVSAHLAILMDLIEEDDEDFRGKRKETLEKMLAEVLKRTLYIMSHADSTKVGGSRCH